MARQPPLPPWLLCCCACLPVALRGQGSGPASEGRVGSPLPYLLTPWPSVSSAFGDHLLGLLSGFRVRLLPTFSVNTREVSHDSLASTSKELSTSNVHRLPSSSEPRARPEQPGGLWPLPSATLTYVQFLETPTLKPSCLYTCFPFCLE